jgi:hypothetical protein
LMQALHCCVAMAIAEAWGARTREAAAYANVDMRPPAWPLHRAGETIPPLSDDPAVSLPAIAS